MRVRSHPLQKVKLKVKEIALNLKKGIRQSKFDPNHIKEQVIVNINTKKTERLQEIRLRTVHKDNERPKAKDFDP